MAEFQWWLLLVGLVAGGGLVAIVSMDGRRREEDLGRLERRAEATWIAERLVSRDPSLDPGTIESVLRVHREYLSLPPPDYLLVDGVKVDMDGRLLAALEKPSDGDPDRIAHEVGDRGSRGADEDLAASRVEQAAPGEQADTGADGEQRSDR